MTEYTALSLGPQQVFSAPSIGHNIPLFDLGHFIDMVLDAKLTGPEKLIQIVIARLAQKSGGTVAPKRSEVLAKASCSEATFKRSFGLLKAFFEVEARTGTTTRYSQKPVPTQDEIAAAITTLRTKTRDHCDTGFKSSEGRHDTKKAGIAVIPSSQSRVLSDTEFVKSKGHSDTGQKKAPPHPPKENINIYNHHSNQEAARGGGEDISGLNGATSLIITKLAGWINPMMPDKRTARASVENFVSLYGGTVVRDAFAELEAKMLHGDIVARPIPYLASACQRKKQKAEAPKKPKIYRQPRPWD